MERIGIKGLLFGQSITYIDLAHGGVSVKALYLGGFDKRTRTFRVVDLSTNSPQTVRASDITGLRADT